MTQATPYTRTTGFSDDERNNAGGRATVRTAQVDAEFDAIGQSLNLTIANLALLQRDDGVMRDGSVPITALGADTLKLLTTNTSVVRGAWVTATAYTIKDLVTQSGNTYICAVSHTSGTFATDLAAIKWVLFQIGANPEAASVPFTPTLNIVSTTTQAAVVEVDSNARTREAAILTDLADRTDATKNAGRSGLNYALSYAPGTLGFDALKGAVSPHGAPWYMPIDGVSDCGPALQQCVIDVANKHPIVIGPYTCVFTTPVELNSQTDTNQYRPAARVYGQGVGRTVIINHTSGHVFTHTLTTAQGTAEAFARGFGFGRMTITGDAGSPAGAAGISFQGAWNPEFRDLLILNLKGNGLNCPQDGRFANTDNYSNGRIRLRGVHISGCTGWGIYSTSYSNTWDADFYITANPGGGAYFAGHAHRLSGAIAGCGNSGDATTGGLVLGRTTDGPSMTSDMHGLELQNNYNFNAWLQCHLSDAHGLRVLDDCSSGSFFAADQIKIGGIPGDSADHNVLRGIYFRLTSSAPHAASTNLVRAVLTAVDGSQTTRYNQLIDYELSKDANVTGTVTPMVVDSSTSSYAAGNRAFLNGQLVYCSSAQASSPSASADVRLSTNWTIPTASATTIPFDTVIYDSHGVIDTTNHDFPAPYKGVLDIFLDPTISGGSAGVGVTFYYQTDTGAGYTTYTSQTCPNGNEQAWCSHIAISVDAGTKVRIQAQTSSGTPIIAASSGSLITFKMR